MAGGHDNPEDVGRRDPETIRREMAESREDIARNMDALERRIEERVMETVNRVADDVESTVSHVSNRVTTTVDGVGRGIQGTADRANEAFQKSLDNFAQEADLQKQYDEHPFAMLGLSMFAGVVIGNVIRRNLEEPSEEPPPRLEP